VEVPRHSSVVEEMQSSRFKEVEGRRRISTRSKLPPVQVVQTVGVATVRKSVHTNTWNATNVTVRDIFRSIVGVDHQVDPPVVVQGGVTTLLEK